MLNPLLVDDLVRRTLEEDFGRLGDLTSMATIPAGTRASAVIAARQAGVIAGMDLARRAFGMVDPQARIEVLLADGGRVFPGDIAMTIACDARALLGAERTALNFLGRLSGIASLTALYVEAISGTRAKIVDTRKTTPLLRAVEKHAVRCGGGGNHRFGLDDAILIKDNHIAVAGGIGPALQAAKRAAGHTVKIEIEVDTLDQLAEVIAEGADIVLLDNMSPEMLRQAVDMVGGRMLTEASGGVSLESVAAIAASGVDLISVGALTHSAKVLDLGLDITV